MQISKQYIIKIIKEEYNKYMKEASLKTEQISQPGQQGQQTISQQPQSQQQQQGQQQLKQNISSQVRILKYMQETLKTTKLPIELQNMIAQIKKSHTPEFLQQVLNVPKTMTINVASVLSNPMELLQSIVDELIKVSIQQGNKKLSSGGMMEERKEGELPALTKEPEERLAKHKAKLRKKHPEVIPPPKL